MISVQCPATAAAATAAATCSASIPVAACCMPSRIRAAQRAHQAAAVMPFSLTYAAANLPQPVCVPRTRRFVLLKERTRLHGEKLMYRQRQQQMPDPSRITKVRKSMARIKQVRGSRLAVVAACLGCGARVFVVGGGGGVGGVGEGHAGSFWGPAPAP